MSIILTNEEIIEIAETLTVYVDDEEKNATIEAIKTIKESDKKIDTIRAIKDALKNADIDSEVSFELQTKVNEKYFI